MTWEALKPAEKATAVDAPLTVTGSLGMKGAHPTVLISVRPWLIDDFPHWFCKGALVGVMLGRGEHFGMVRITPQGKHAVRECRTGRKGGGQQPLHLKLKGVPGTTKYLAKRVDFDFGDDWIEVSFAKFPVPSAVIVSPAPTAKSGPEKSAFSMLGGRVSR